MVFMVTLALVIFSLAIVSVACGQNYSDDLMSFKCLFLNSQMRYNLFQSLYCLGKPCHGGYGQRT